MSPSPSGKIQGGNRRRAIGICLILAAITFVTFGRTLNCAFVNYDDDVGVYQNQVVSRGLTLSGIRWAFTNADITYWQPLTWLSHELDCQLFGLKPAGHHLTNVLFHAASVILFFLVLLRTTDALWRSAFVAALFAIHPLRVESVAWITERRDVLSGLFFVLTLGMYGRYVRERKRSFYGWALVFFTLGLMSKPMLVTVPLVMLLMDYWPLGRTDSIRRLITEKLPFAALSALSVAVTIWAQKSALPATASYPLPDRLGNALCSCATYLGQMVYPSGLALLYPFPKNGPPAWQMALSGLLLTVIGTAVWRQRRQQPWLLFGFLWYLVMLLPVLGLVQSGTQAHADRFTYLPQIGIYMAVTWLVAECGANWKAIMPGLMIAVLCALMICSFHQTGFWRNSETLWNRTLACTSNNVVAQVNLGRFLAVSGRMDEAIAHFQQALQMDPNDPAARFDLGVAYVRNGRQDEALAELQMAAFLDPSMVAAHYRLACALVQKGKMPDAISEFQKTLQLEPNNTSALDALALILASCPDVSLRDGKRALQLAQQASDLDGGRNPLIMRTLAISLAATGRLEDAERADQKAIELARQAGQQNLAAQLARELQLYQAQSPMHH